MDRYGAPAYELYDPAQKEANRGVSTIKKSGCQNMKKTTSLACSSADIQPMREIFGPSPIA